MIYSENFQTYFHSYVNDLQLYLKCTESQIYSPNIISSCIYIYILFELTMSLDIVKNSYTIYTLQKTTSLHILNNKPNYIDLFKLTTNKPHFMPDKKNTFILHTLFYTVLIHTVDVLSHYLLLTTRIP